MKCFFASRLKVLALAGAVVAVMVGLCLPAGKARAQNGKTKKILFVSNREDKKKFNIYSMNPDGSKQARLSKGDAFFELDPAVSPDGSKIAYTVISDKEDNNGIHVMNADGSEATLLAKTPVKSIAFGPSWSPDGKRIAFSSMSPGTGPLFGNADLVVMDADGKNPKRLGVQGMMPVWSRDGKQLLYTATVEGDAKNPSSPRLFVVDADGKNARELIKDRSMMGRWSPDGKRLVYMGASGKQPDVYVSNADGADPVQLTKTEDPEFGPEWSPDGKKIIFTRMTKGANEANIFAIDSDGQNEVQLTRDAGLNMQGGAALMQGGRKEKAPKKDGK